MNAYGRHMAPRHTWMSCTTCTVANCKDFKQLTNAFFHSSFTSPEILLMAPRRCTDASSCMHCTTLEKPLTIPKAPTTANANCLNGLVHMCREIGRNGFGLQWLLCACAISDIMLHISGKKKYNFFISTYIYYIYIYSKWSPLTFTKKAPTPANCSNELVCMCRDQHKRLWLAVVTMRLCCI